MIFTTERKSTEKLLLWANNFTENIVKENAPLVLLGKDYHALIDSNIVSIGAFRPSDELMYRMFLNNLFRIDTSHIDFDFLLLLHEIGHIMTYHSFCDDEINDYEKWVEEFEGIEHTNNNYLLEYYDLTIEWTATDWAVNYIANNENIIIVQEEYRRLLNKMRKNITTCE